MLNNLVIYPLPMAKHDRKGILHLKLLAVKFLSLYNLLLTLVVIFKVT